MSSSCMRCFWDTVIGRKSQILAYTTHNALPLTVSPLKFHQDCGHHNTTVHSLLCVCVCVCVCFLSSLLLFLWTFVWNKLHDDDCAGFANMFLRLAVRVEHRPVIERQTDRQTDRQTHCHSVTCYTRTAWYYAIACRQTAKIISKPIHVPVRQAYYEDKVVTFLDTVYNIFKKFFRNNMAYYLRLTALLIYFSERLHASLRFQVQVQRGSGTVRSVTQLTKLNAARLKAYKLVSINF